MTRTCSLFLILFFFFITGPYKTSHAQDHTSVIQYYMKQSGGFSPLYNGKIPPQYLMRHKGTYYLESDTFYRGTLQYNEKRYVDLLLNVNAHTDELYIRMPQYNSSSVLLKEHVESFTLDQMEFIHMVKEKWPGVPQEGYYQILFQGNKISVLKRTLKRMNSSTTVNEMNFSHVFEEDIYYYILQNGVFHTVKRRSSLLRILREKRKELTHHIRKHKLGFSKNKIETTLASCAAFYENEEK